MRFLNICMPFLCAIYAYMCPKRPQQYVLTRGSVVTDEQNQQTLAFSHSFIDKCEFAVRDFYPILYGRCFNLRFVPYNLHHSFTSSPGEKTFEVKIISPGEHLTRIWLQVLDRKDGSFLVRYRMYSTYPDLHIHILLKNEHVANSPFILEG